MSRLVLDTNCLIHRLFRHGANIIPYGIVLFVVKILFVSLMKLLKSTLR